MGNRKTENIHDKFFKSSFSIKEVALGFVYEFLSEEISSIIQPDTFKLQSGSYVDKHLSEKFSDIVSKQLDTYFSIYLFDIFCCLVNKKEVDLKFYNITCPAYVFPSNKK